MTSKELCEAINVNLYIPIHEDVSVQLLNVINTLCPILETNDVHNCIQAFSEKKCVRYIKESSKHSIKTYMEKI